MKQVISITAISSISALGAREQEIWDNYLSSKSKITTVEVNGENVYVAATSKEDRILEQNLRLVNAKYKSLDRSVLLAILASRAVLKKSGWSKNTMFGINLGSSRGATSLFETYYSDFLKQGKAAVLASPTTTLGNISSWVAHDLKSKGPEISHSVTCSTGLHSLLNGVAWLSSGMINSFLVGGSEAPLTPFTIAQMQALKIYAKGNDLEFPCRALDKHKKHNSMVLGEGAAVASIELGVSKNALALIKGVGYATEVLEHNTSISSNAKCIQDAMRMAINDSSLDEIDVIITHTPGTIKGDLAEINAIKEVFKDKIPAITTNKWKLGHTFATSGMLSLELAILMIKNQKFIPVPYVNNTIFPKQINRVLVNAVGFGGNAVSVLLSRPYK